VPMTNEDRDMLVSLRRQHSDLHHMLERLSAQIVALESRTGIHVIEHILPPVPPEAFLPPLPPEPVELPPIPAAEIALPPLPSAVLPPVPVIEKANWPLRLGVTFGLLLLFLMAGAIDLAFHLHQKIGLLGRFGVAGLAGVTVMFIGDRFDRSAGRSIFGKLLLVIGLLGLYVAFHEANELAISAKVPHPILGGMFLLVWTLYAFLVAERHRSQLIGVTGVIFGFISMALVPAAWFSLGMDLILSAIAAAFLMKRGWTTLASFAVFGAYFAIFRRLVFDSYGDLVLDTSRALPFLPPAVYLVFAWAFFTTAIILCTSPVFRGGKRFFLASLNNAGLVILLALTAYISGYGLGSVGWSLFDTGVLFLVISRFAGFAEQDPVDLMGVYAAQGLGVFTAGIIVAFTGIWRAILLLLETLLFGIAGAFAGDRILITATYAAGFFATVFSIWQIAIYAHHPWLLGLGGAVVMLINAWSCRGDVRHSPVARSSTVFATSCYCLLALGLIFAAFNSEMTDASLPVALALGAIALTFLIYQFSIFELPSLAQILMLGALVLVLFPIETGEELPGWSVVIVALATLVLLTWWSRQRIMLPGAWVGPVSYLYSLALVYLAVLAVRPYLGAQSWMVTESLLSVAFLIYGAFTRVWPLAISGQILLFLSLYHVFYPPQTVVYSWTGIAAAMPVLVTYFTARAADRWLVLFPEITEANRSMTSFFISVYKFVALLGVIRWTFGIVPASEHMAAFLFLGSFLIAHNIRHPDSLGVRAGMLLGALGMLISVTHAHHLATWPSAFAALLFLAQIPLLAPSRSLPISRFESWVLTAAAVFTAGYFLSVWSWPHPKGTHSHLSLVWAFYALLLYVFGLLSSRPRLRWCGLVVLAFTMLRIVCFDIWTLSLGLRVITMLLFALLAIFIGLCFAFTKLTASENQPKTL
jgi:hypothetical protein